ncbi:MAG: TDT family transporter [Methanobrevibacter sp.]|nr:TDT family transporter [Methanobrevibacter sp.]
MNLIKQLPIPISGLILALVSTGILLQDINPYLKYIFGTIGVILIISLMLKVILYPGEVKNDLKNPIILSSSGTFSMSLMLLSTYFTGFSSSFAFAMWIIGVALHILLMIYFTYRFIIREFNISTVYPTWWIVYVGITMGSITAHFFGLSKIDHIFFAIGFISMIWTTPLVVYRYIKYSNIPDMNKPLVCIFTALYSILIVGYANSAELISNEFIFGLYALSCLFYIFAIYKFISYNKLDFYPSFSAFTFPFVISASATKEIVKISSNLMINNLLTIETAIATLLVVYVLIRYIKFLKIVGSRN